MTGISRRKVVLGGAVLGAGALAAPLGGAPATASPALTTRYGFNDEGVPWRLFDDGARASAKSGKPIFFLVHATWCLHCKVYRQMFFDPEVVRRIKRFTPILLDADAQPDINERYAPTGPYVPRTMFLDSKGALLPDLHLPYEEHVYFVDYLDGPRDLRRLLTMAEKRFFGV